MVKRAILSVSDKTGIVELARRLAAQGVTLLSTGGTMKAIEEAGIPVTGVSDVTGFPECLDGRVKTLHPAIHAGLLAVRDNPEHMKQLEQLGVEPIDMVVINLYPFRATIEKPGVTFDEAIENIDIGGPTMLRAAAKNAQDVVVVIDPADYDRVHEGDELCLPAVRERLSRGEALTLENRTTGETYALSSAFTERQTRILLSGGLLYTV